jgi:glycosyltransferase involved in cell wall biosynthesis
VTEGGAGNQAGAAGDRPLVSVVLPAYNEAAILAANLKTLREYLATIEDRYRFEIVVVNDGSLDATGAIADEAALGRDDIRVLHHPANFGLGQALKFAFNHCDGDYVVVMDIDLSYSPDHIGRMLDRMRATHAKVVLASPYVEGGSLANVPWLRRVLSVGANRFLSLFARDRYRTLVPRGRLSTLTGMVRAYDGRFLRGLSPRSISMEINPEIIYKSMLLRARIEEIPARLDWHLQNAKGPKRRSSMKLLQQIFAVLLSGFIFRPFMFFILPGVALLGFALYCNVWMFIHFFRQYARLTQYTWFMDRASWSVAAAYAAFPHTFTVGLLSLMLAIQLLGLGIMAMQNKKYFEEIFYLVSMVYRQGLDEEEGE